ncbi:5'-methylthioadenosine/S-adenosylhomocysteine nucleosidase [Comamonas sp. Z3]|uniref:5'-methylthioadenosine/S-adenosylhomocysteine nucleosidase family protein n=1 Tax=Comamonas sp. Z3 TaxID=2601247 RepID=UPI0011E82A92|nr:5'-methylthioadenosine/S-adenosylhomocysteine nucleosidase [Comamonas sp. Z3]TYK67881.1 5'-methylthioadenosine/S-adenosylhomocysteine nucleosidase [Comamonas sp. Z3]
MKILVLEDDDRKFEEVSNFINIEIASADIQRKKNWLDYSRAVAIEKFDLIILDLLVPRSAKDAMVENHYLTLVETTRDYHSKSFKTPAIVLTRHSLDEGDFVHDLNLVDITVIAFNDHGDWKDALKRKILTAQPQKKFDIAIICALDKEAAAFEGLTDTWGPVVTISGLSCREVRIGEYKVVIVRPQRMGLVASALSASFTLERFEPRLLCMSGICGGVAGEAEIYDLLVTQICHQHDAGKWSASGFKSEHYDVQIEVDVQNKLHEIASSQGMVAELLMGVNAGVSEVPKGKEYVGFKIHSSAPTSSGSAVIAEDGKTSSLNVGQRKLAGFDMEIYSVYEAARHAKNRTAFFAAKSVVDDGGANKGDAFHRIACLLSAKFVVKAIRAGIADVWKT